MTEPTGVGFTGVIWEARATERLAHDLTDGPGAIPLADAGAAYARLAAGLAESALEYPQIVAAIQQAWQSNESANAAAQIAKFQQWLADAAAAAGANAVKAEAQAAAHQIARLAMPSAAEVSLTKAAKDGIEKAGAALGAPLVAAAAKVEADQQQAKDRASRVMETYEKATEPLSTAWDQAKPPQIATSVALDAERAAEQAPTPKLDAGNLPGGFSGGLPLGFPIAMARQQTKFYANTISQSAAKPTTIVTPAATPIDTVAPMTPMAPGMAAAAANNCNDEHHAKPTRAGAAEESSGVNLPEGWLGLAEHTETATDQQSADIDEGVFAVGSVTASPAVLGEAADR
ncbi:PPE domain-containing protein [Antrihabitans sp. YC3-6]|uniref:PPE domain-containing protein n=1 Tax=Antrihabitans stalagmiti TaxID=2799499 RepID=A0A934NNS5_9NOCA|nr:PPE domain-containing protein [Antrihabitans stalagmiti]MBJ8338584.1 PPE domain-containing protein [Antrihabitans stalagmiti]